MRRFALVLSFALVAASAPILSTVASAAPPNAGAPATAEPAAVPDQLLVGYDIGASAAERADARGQAGARRLEDVVQGDVDRRAVELVALPAGSDRDAAIRRFEQNPNVAYAEPNWIVTHEATADDPYYVQNNLWGMYGDATTPANQYGSQAGEAWAAGNTGAASVVVGVIDTGVDIGHSDLAANVWRNPKEAAGTAGVDDDGNGYVDDINGWDFYGGNASVYDDPTVDSHGTHVAGTIAGVGGNGSGVVGVAWTATVVPVKFLGPSGTTANAVKAVDYLTDLKALHGLNLVASNNSWGGGAFSSSLHSAIERAGTAGILFVAAAGNGGDDKVGDDNDGTPHYPSSYTNASVIAVASITSTGARSSFSNYGDVSVDLGAPGSSILSTVPGGGYDYKSGTSMATPHVTGGVVLAAASGTSGSAALKARILDLATSTTSLLGKTVTGGRLDLSTFAVPRVTVNVAPTALADSYSVTLGQNLQVAAPGVLKNDSDPEGADLTAKLVSEPTESLTFSADGGFTYTPAASGTYTFAYVANDGTTDSAESTVTITVKEATTTRTKGGGGGGKPSAKGTSTK